MKTQAHYEKHLASFYAWMTGDFDQKSAEFQSFLAAQNICPIASRQAIDLGAGHGIQTVALLNMGFEVTAIDFSDVLLNELMTKTKKRAVKLVNTDISKVKEFESLKPELIVCCGDTITHLEHKKAVKNLIVDCKHILSDGGKLILSFRDYTHMLRDDQRFIPVKSDDTHILTCILEYETYKVKVTDLLYEKTEKGWEQKVSSYEKVRLSKQDVMEYIEQCGMTILFDESLQGMQTIIAVRN